VERFIPNKIDWDSAAPSIRPPLSAAPFSSQFSNLFNFHLAVICLLVEHPVVKAELGTALLADSSAKT